MKNILLIIALFPTLCSAQFLVNGQKSDAAKLALIDLGGNGAGDHASFIDVGEMTPSNSSRIGVDANGRWWNNITNGQPGVTLLGGAVATNGQYIGDLNISVDQWARGTFSSTDSNMNFQGASTAVGIYPLTATMDSWYLHSSAGVTTMTITIPAGWVADMTFWGSRTTTGANRTFQVKKSTDGSYTAQYNSLNNTTYSQNCTLTGLSGTVQLNMRVQPGQTFAHLGVIEIKKTN